MRQKRLFIDGPQTRIHITESTAESARITPTLVGSSAFSPRRCPLSRRANRRVRGRRSGVIERRDALVFDWGKGGAGAAHVGAVPLPGTCHLISCTLNPMSSAPCTLNLDSLAPHLEPHTLNPTLGAWHPKTYSQKPAPPCPEPYTPNPLLNHKHQILNTSR